MFELFLISVLIGFCSANITKLLDYSFNKGNILDWYYIILLKYIEPISKKIAKPLGTCIKCMSVWVCLIIFIIFSITLSISWFYFFISLGVSSYFFF
jgi:hypothetical protein